MDNKGIFAKNLNKYMAMKKVTRKELSVALGYSYFTVCDWANGKKYPRMDKVEAIANYFGVLKSDLIEEKMTEAKEKDNDIMADIIVRMRTDEDFSSLVKSIYLLDPGSIKRYQAILNALTE